MCPVLNAFAREGIQLGLSAIKIGAAPYFDLQVWQPREQALKPRNVRAGVNQALRGGVQIEGAGWLPVMNSRKRPWSWLPRLA